MKIAVFADIHSNFTAFSACVNKAVESGADKMLFLGDYISDCAFPQDTMGLMYKLKDNYDCRFVRGNREGYMLGETHGATNWYPSSGCGSLYYTFNNLTKRELEFFASLPIYDKVRFGSMPEIGICHGSPRKDNEFIGDDTCRYWLENMETDLLLCGHTHRRSVFGEKQIINFGSLGMQLDGTTKAKLGIIEPEGTSWHHEFADVEYDISSELHRLEKSGLYELAPVWTKATERILTRGDDITERCLERIKQLAKPGDAWPFPEEYWQQAEKELF